MQVLLFWKLPGPKISSKCWHLSTCSEPREAQELGEDPEVDACMAPMSTAKSEGTSWKAWQGQFQEQRAHEQRPLL